MLNIIDKWVVGLPLLWFKILLFILGVYMTAPLVRLMTCMSGNWDLEVNYAIRVLNVIDTYCRQIAYYD